MPHDKLSVECLSFAQNFETYWAYYTQSSGRLFASECRKSALLFLEVFDKLASLASEVKNPVDLGLGKETDVDDIIAKLRRWAKSSELYPYPDPAKSRFMLFLFMTGLKTILFRRLGLNRYPPMVMTSEEVKHSESYVKWCAHLPRSALLWRPDPIEGEFESPTIFDSDSLIEKACDSPTIVVVGDIRNSQDLMTYSINSQDFSQRMVQLITATRETLDKHTGFFDKFTGDGFLAYFNEAICKVTGSNYIECFFEFLREHLRFSESHFQEWVKNVKKLPNKPVGLAVGADIGNVSFQNLNYHLIAVGDPIVWASRMASSASANEVVVNNLLYEALRERDDVKFKQREAKTKSGEGFLTRIMSLKELGL